MENIPYFPPCPHLTDEQRRRTISVVDGVPTDKDVHHAWHPEHGRTDGCYCLGIRQLVGGNASLVGQRHFSWLLGCRCLDCRYPAPAQLVWVKPVILH